MYLIVVVHAEHLVRDRLCETIRRAGFAVMSAASFDEAADLWRILKPDAVVADREPSSGLYDTVLGRTPLLLYTDRLSVALERIDSERVFRAPSEESQLLAALETLCRGP